MKLSGAEIIIKLLERQVSIPWRGSPAARTCRCTTRCSKARFATSSPATNRRRVHRARHGALNRKTRRMLRHLGPGSDESHYRHRRRRLDSVPLIAITGQVPTSMLGSDAFQEVDIYNMTIPITKHKLPGARRRRTSS